MMRSTRCSVQLAVLLLVQAVTCQYYEIVPGVGTFKKSIAGQPKSLRGATEDCANTGARLIVIDSEQKYSYASAFINDMGTYEGASNNRDIWVGVQVIGGAWKTVHGVGLADVSYFHWCDNRPNSGTCVVYSRNLQCNWDAPASECTSETRKQPYICEMLNSTSCNRVTLAS